MLLQSTFRHDLTRVTSKKIPGTCFSELLVNFEKFLREFQLVLWSQVILTLLATILGLKYLRHYPLVSVEPPIKAKKMESRLQMHFTLPDQCFYAHECNAIW